MDEVYTAIDSLEASTLPAEGLFVYRDAYLWLLILGLALVVAGNLLSYGYYKVVGE
jgi:hypothetical protein